MQKVIIDTNVLISALIQRNYPNFIIYNYVLHNLVEVCISDELFEEYLEVINRPKFNKYPDFISKAEFVLAQLESKAKKFYPTKRFKGYRDKPLRVDASAWIGIIERILILIFILSEQFQSIGFLEAAKSIFRFSEIQKEGNPKAEYFSLGTLASFLLAVVVGVGIKYLVSCQLDIVA
jgi:putative PIN family toxin of toxin-antitoxin system